MKIALLGTRGIPANYGGFETFTEELSVRLAARGHQLTVYCRTRNVGRREPLFRGVELVLFPTVRHKYLDTVVHTLFSTLHLLSHRQEIALYCNAANAIFTIAPRLLGMPTVLNVDGLERKRRKWNAPARGWYRLSERLATWFPSEVVTDALVIQNYYLERYRKATHLIAYGTQTGKLETTKTLDRLGLRPGDYFLYVSRLEPENNALLVVKAFERTAHPQKLVIVGDAPYSHDYIRRLKQTRDPRILFPGSIYGTGYHELLSHCFAYIHATEVGGTHPALIEAMGRGCCLLFLDTPENREVSGDVGFPYQPSEDALVESLDRVIALSPDKRLQMGQAAMEAARRRYDWEAIVDQYERLFAETVKKKG